jgi:hypothetical protein
MEPHDNARFSMMWVNDPVTHRRPMSTCRMTLRDAGGDAMGQSHGGLTCTGLFLDQVHIQFRPGASIESTEFQTGDNAGRNWRDDTTELYVRTSPGRRSVCYTVRGSDPLQATDATSVPHVSLIYTTALNVVPEASDTSLVRTYRPLRDLPVATYLNNVSELTVDLLWPLLQGKPTTTPGSWFVPDYRIERVICDFTARV